MRHPRTRATATPLFASALLAGGLLATAPASPQAGNADSAVSPAERLRTDVAYLASEDLAGRLTGTEGEELAGRYLAAQLKALGAVPIPGDDDFFSPFEFTAGTKDDGTKLRIHTAQDGSPNAPQSVVERTGVSLVQALSFSDSGSASGEVVFAGYGLTVPESQDFGYDSYATLDVKDKIVLALRYFPEDLEGQARATLARYSGLRYKAMTARENGAKALILVTGPRSPNAGEIIPMTFDTAIAGSGILAASIAGEVAEELFRTLPDQDLESAQKAFDSGNPHVAGFALPGVTVDLEVAVQREHREARNVLGMIRGRNAATRSDPDKDFVVLGAHYDHLGQGRSGNSLAKKEESGGIHYGADDNASGVAAVLEAARQLAEADLGRGVVVGFWSGEELGLLGSSAFLRQPAIAPEEIAANVNLDMVGRMRDNKLTIQAVGSSEIWPSLVERSNVPIGFDINTQADPYLPTDSASFNSAKIPSLNLFTGSHENYHRPSDRADTVNYEDLARVARFTALLVDKLSHSEQPPEFVAVERKTQTGGDRDSVRAYTGTIPDYTTEVEGLRLGGVIGGGPADEAGLLEGDVIVEFGGQAIANIYDYTYALDAVKIDVTLKVVFLRDGKRMETTITPRSRK